MEELTIQVIALRARLAPATTTKLADSRRRHIADIVFAHSNFDEDDLVRGAGEPT